MCEPSRLDAVSDSRICIEELLAHRSWLERLARTLTRDPHAADDAVQNTWMSAIRHPPTRSTCMRAWLRTVLRHEMIQSIRAITRHREHEAFGAHAANGEASPESELEADERCVAIRRALESMREPYRSTLWMYYGDGLTSAQIARKLGVPSATVRWRVKRGVNALRASVGRAALDLTADRNEPKR